MEFALGYIAGLTTAATIFIVLAYFRAAIEQRVKVVETVLHAAGPKPKGSVFVPGTDADEARNELIAANRANGLDTRFEDLE